MNASERYIFAIYEIALEVRETLTYFVNIPDQPHTYEKYQIRKNIISTMMAEGTPFDLFCKSNNNPETGVKIGDEIRAKLKSFYEDVYSENSNIITVRKEDNNNVIHVEESLYMNLIDYIIGIRETFNDILAGYKQTLIKEGKLEDEFKDMLKYDERYYRAFCLRVLAMMLNTKFIEYNNSINDFLKSTRGATLEDAKKDPSVIFVSKEIEKLFGFVNFVINHSHEEDEAFKNACNLYKNALNVFTGAVKAEDFEFANGSKPANIKEFFQKFASIFAEIITYSQNEFMKNFIKVYNSIVAYEQELKNTPKDKEKEVSIETPVLEEKKEEVKADKKTAKKTTKKK